LALEITLGWFRQRFLSGESTLEMSADDSEHRVTDVNREWLSRLDGCIHDGHALAIRDRECELAAPSFANRAGPSRSLF